MAGMAGNANENDVENDKKALSFGSAEGCVYICFFFDIPSTTVTD